jgi:hypothetical protein
MLTLFALLACDGDPPAQALEENTPETCSDLVDNDGDTLVDCDDDGCWPLEVCAGSDSDTDVDTDSDADPGSFTIMMYEDADNNLEDVLLQDVNEAEAADLPAEGINFIVLVDRAEGYTSTDGDWTGAKLFRLEHDDDLSAINSPRLADPDFLGLTDDSENGEELDMGSVETLTAFIDFCQANYPADNYILHISDHGDGWTKGGDPDQPAQPPLLKGACTDDSSGNSLSIAHDFPVAMEGKGIGAITFDACLLGTIEVAWAVKDHCEYMGASVMSVPGPGWDYTTTYNAWLADPSLESWVVTAVDKFIEQYDSQSGVGFSAIDLAALDDFAGPFDAFVADALQADMAAIKEAKTAAFKPQFWGWDGMMDFRDFAVECDGLVDSELVDGVIEAFDATLIHFLYSDDLSEMSGMSIYAPSQIGPWGGYADEYSQIPFALDTEWEDLIQQII